MNIGQLNMAKVLLEDNPFFEKNKNLIFIKPGHIVETEKGFFIVIGEGKNNIKTIVPIIPTSEFASTGDYIFVAPIELLPIADRWTVLSDYKLNIPYGTLKYGYIHGNVSQKFVEAIKEKNQINRDEKLKEIFDSWLENYIKISNFISQKNKVWLEAKTASDRISKFENGVFVNIEPDSLELISLTNNILIEIYIGDTLFDVVHYGSEPIKIQLDNVDPVDFSENLVMKIHQLI